MPDVTLINSGTLRADRTIPPGVITMLDLTALLPLLDPLVYGNFRIHCYWTTFHARLLLGLPQRPCWRHTFIYLF